MIIVEHAKSCRIAVGMCANIISHARARAYHQNDSDRGRGGEMFPSGGRGFHRSRTEEGVLAAVEMTNANTQTQKHTNVRISVRTRSAKTMGENGMTSDITWRKWGWLNWLHPLFIFLQGSNSAYFFSLYVSLPSLVDLVISINLLVQHESFSRKILKFFVCKMKELTYNTNETYSDKTIQQHFHSLTSKDESQGNAKCHHHLSVTYVWCLLVIL